MSLDAGSSSIKAALGEMLQNESINVLGIVKHPSEGIKKGNVIDIDAASRSIDACLNELEKLTGVEIGNALAGYSGTSISSVRNRAVVAVGNTDYEISQEDKERVLLSAQNISLPPDKTIVQLIERQYVVDGYDGVREPVGMVGSRLESEVLMLVAASAAMQNLQRCASRINLHLDRLVYNQLLGAQAVLLPDELQMGVILVDMGAGTTEISVFQQGSLLFTSVLPLGGDYITRDLAIVLKTSIDEAIRIKEAAGIALSSLEKSEHLINVCNIQGKEFKQVSQQIVTEIIAARVQEITEMIVAEVNQYVIGPIPGGMVLAGGCAELDGLVEAIEEYSGMPVRVGSMESIKGLDPQMNKPENAVVVGSLLYGMKHIGWTNLEIQDNVGSAFYKINHWLRDLFS
ncbi:MAG: cell division protein FtsA [Bacillota bacterium]|nr:cell division protein FtsA [Bacillota bacterium]